MSKMNLKQLAELFVQSAATEELPEKQRQFAAQLAVLTRYIGKMGAKVNELDMNMTALGELVIGSQPAAPVTAPNVPNAPQASPADIEAMAAEQSDDPEEDEAKAMAERVQQETEAEVAAMNAKPPTIVPPRKNGGPITVEDAS